ncbi:hypothetical protein M1307_02815 [Patescibacteria group bacterium]|nr:hypothetical protein [Patescibacteria group bacterium]
MKNPKIKIPNIKSPNLGRWVPYIFAGMFFVIGVVILSFGYFAFKRPAEQGVISKADGELQEISIELDRDKVLNLFDANYDISKVKEPPFKTKNPFLFF